jgi:hypothetical protein
MRPYFLKKNEARFFKLLYFKNQIINSNKITFELYFKTYF